jgi:hypothetical protein
MKKIGSVTLLSLVLLLCVSCKQKKKAKPANEQFLPVLSFIKGQVAQVDTSLYSIRKVVYVDSTKSDTFYYKREQFRELASDFLNLPDISSAGYEDKYKEESQFDEALNRVILTYLPVKPENEAIQRIQVMIHPDTPEDKITSIFIDYAINNKDSSVQKRMLWQVDKSFQVATIRQVVGQEETTSTYKVIWNDEEDDE